MQKPHVGFGVDRLNLRPQLAQRLALDASQDLYIAPLAAKAVGRELTGQHLPFPFQQGQLLPHDAHRQTEGRRHALGRRRSMRAAIPTHEVANGPLNRFLEGERHPHGNHNAQCIAEARSIFDCRHARPRCGVEAEHSPGDGERRQGIRCVI